MNLIFKVFNEQQAEVIKPWFDDPDTQKWLGGRKWVDNIFRMLDEPVGAEFRGEKKISAYAYVVYDGNEPVGFIDGEITDKWVHYGGESDGEPIYLGEIEGPALGIAFVVNAKHRSKGYGTEIIKTLIKRPEFMKVKVFGAGVEPDNIGSIKTLEVAGFKSDYTPDFEDMLYFFYRR
jgi:RimJ/RimL family protein N-acetyltransferase